ncbi:ubiquitin-domain-containing protein [Auriculariales sp. MPI-PUGE-AT-0066]|nr:ubiquitin-domain-containing protein [Auriculariales sp. MPI-PUGE-AT-0066]
MYQDPILEPSTDEEVNVQLVTLTGRRETVRVQRASLVDDALKNYADRNGLDAASMNFVHQGQPYVYGAGKTFNDEPFAGLDIVVIFTIIRLRKPVIYLHSPTLLKATVSLSLSMAWSFSLLYPVAPIVFKGGCDHTSWTVDVRTDGTLYDTRTDTEVAYLYWEGETNLRPISPPMTPDVPGAELFSPQTAVLLPSNSVLLCFEDVPKYLDTALKAMSLSVEARTSFITFWLPAMYCHKHVALRFLPQGAYEGAAPLSVSPSPDVVTRVFMIFRGILDSEISQWTRWSDPEAWKDVVGVDTARAADPKLFRVLEWGGMEVTA